jgi:hypothetical protein
MLDRLLIGAELGDGKHVFYPSNEIADFVDGAICHLVKESESKWEWIIAEPWVVEATRNAFNQKGYSYGLYSLAKTELESYVSVLGIGSSKVCTSFIIS